MAKHSIRKTTLHGLTRAKVASRLATIARDMKQAERKFSPLLAQLHDHFKHSGANLIHYLVLRSHEIREMQEYLHHIGLSSLANSESHTLSQIMNVLSWLKYNEPNTRKITSSTFEEASRLRLLHTEELLGVVPGQDRPHIMVTFSTTLMQDRKLVEEMLNEGMTVARINCAHDTPDDWLNMITVLKKAIAKTGKDCKIYMDLAGPKIRIKSIQALKKEESEELPVKEGQKLILTHPDAPGGQKKKDKRKVDILHIEPKELLDMVQEGEHIFFDDGKFEARVTKVLPGQIEVKVVRISAKNHYLKPQRGINLPDSEITIPTLTAEDKQNIPFICEHADMVGYSFVNSPEDIETLREEINKYDSPHKPSIILKIERLTAIQNLPALLMNGMKDEALGVMIARGDLAVEIGFERLSEIQEEILWICEAAHVPVIWATQVLETLNKTGYATRSEITDAAMSGRAECVMLNKGKYIVKTIATLEDILTRQQGHVNKKRYIMRPLGIAKSFIQP
jgi:pyruvate kinase